ADDVGASLGELETRGCAEAARGSEREGPAVQWRKRNVRGIGHGNGFLLLQSGLQQTRFASTYGSAEPLPERAFPGAARGHSPSLTRGSRHAVLSRERGAVRPSPKDGSISSFCE